MKSSHQQDQTSVKSNSSSNILSMGLSMCLLIGLLLFTLYCLSSAFNRGSANAWYFNAEFALNEWAEKGKIESKEAYQVTLAAIQKAQKRDDTHPHYAHMVGRIMHWGVDMGYEDATQLIEIKQWYLLATALRPMWPDPWVDLLRLNNYLEGFNEETKNYAAQALKFGPYIDLVTTGTLELWLMNWHVLSAEEKNKLFEQFAIATKQPKVLSRVLEIATKLNRENLLCVQITYNKAYQKQKDSWVYRRYCK
jgi:hypothetical protein